MKKILVMLLAALLCVSLFACSGSTKNRVDYDDDDDEYENGNDNDNDGSHSADSDEIFDRFENKPDGWNDGLLGESSDEVSVDKIEPEDFIMSTPVKDLGGKEICVFNRDFGISIVEHSGEILYDEENPSSVDEAKKWIIDQVEELYNVVIVGEKSDYGDSTVAVVERQVLSGMEDCHIFFDAPASVAPLVGEAFLQDLKTISTIDLSASWWDQNAINDLSIGGEAYFACGDINTFDDFGTSCVLFNKNMKNRYIPDVDLYALARNGRWTYDTFCEICTDNGITRDSNGDGALDEKDIWAFGTENYNVFVHLVSSGERIAKKGRDDLPYLTYSDEPTKTYSILNKILDFYNDKKTVMVANNYIAKFPDNPWEATVQKAFIEGRELFYMCGLIHVPSFRMMEDEFGILPVPKWNANQDSYYSSVSHYNSTVMFIPVGISGQNLEDVGLVASAIAELSEEKLTPEMYDTFLEYRDSRDDESAEMLDIIFDSRVFDLGMVYGWGFMNYEYISLDRNIVSRFESRISSAETELEEFIESIDWQR